MTDSDERLARSLLCVAFAALFSEEKIFPEACAELYLTQYLGSPEELMVLLRTGGYAV